MSEISVHVIQENDRENLTMRYREPGTNRHVKRSTGTSNRKQADKKASEWQAELNLGFYKAPSRVSWEEFCDRYISEGLSGRAPSTIDKVDGTFAHVNRILAPAKLRDLNEDGISRWKAELSKGRSAATVGCYCRHLKAALNWAKEMKMISDVPKIHVPKGSGERKMKGRAIVTEEHERILVAVEKAVEATYVDSWQWFLDGLWWSGLRHSEALGLSWDESAAVCIMVQSGYRPVFRFRADGHKARRAELAPIAPEFCEMIDRVPEAERVGVVFPLPGCRNRRRQNVGKVIRAIVRRAGVYGDPAKKKLVTPHDYRRSFGTRWAKRVMPPVLKRLMRHRNISTTLQYYVDLDVEDVSAELWRAYEAGLGTSLGTREAFDPVKTRV